MDSPEKAGSEKGPQMDYGKTATKIFGVLGVAVPLLLILRPG